MQNIPLFSKRPNAIKRALIQWLDEKFHHERASKNRSIEVESIQFNIGDLEDGVRNILGDESIPPSTIRTHTANLKTDRFFKMLDGDDPYVLDPSVPERTRTRNVHVTKEQMDRLLRIRESWDLARPTANPPASRDSL